MLVLQRLGWISLMMVALCVVGGGPAWAGDPQLASATGGIPDVVSSSIREQLRVEGVRVVVDGKTLGDFWFRKTFPTAQTGEAGLAVNFAALGESTLVGVASFPGTWSDYKAQPIPAGVYTLRYEIEPADGNHMGVSSYRDFLLLAPVGADAEIQSKLNYEQMVALSIQASGTNHPAVLALFPISEADPGVRLAKNELDQWTLVVKIDGVTLGIVLLGQGQVAD